MKMQLARVVCEEGRGIQRPGHIGLCRQFKEFGFDTKVYGSVSRKQRVERWLMFCLFFF